MGRSYTSGFSTSPSLGHNPPESSPAQVLRKGLHVAPAQPRSFAVGLAQKKFLAEKDQVRSRATTLNGRSYPFHRQISTPAHLAGSRHPNAASLKPRTRTAALPPRGRPRRRFPSQEFGRPPSIRHAVCCRFEGLALSSVCLINWCPCIPNLKRNSFNGTPHFHVEWEASQLDVQISL